MQKHVRPKVKKETKNLVSEAHNNKIQEEIEEQVRFDFEEARYGSPEIWPSFMWGYKEAI